MNEQEIRKHWQAANGQSQIDSRAYEVFAESEEQRAAALIGLASDRVAADLARVVLALADDADQVERGVRQLRQQGPKRLGVKRLGWAMAASAGMFALLFAAQEFRAPNDVEGNQPITRVEQILTNSFESTAADIPATESAANNALVFSGGFDS